MDSGSRTDPQPDRQRYEMVLTIATALIVTASSTGRPSLSTKDGRERTLFSGAGTRFGHPAEVPYIGGSVGPSEVIRLHFDPEWIKKEYHLPATISDQDIRAAAQFLLDRATKDLNIVTGNYLEWRELCKRYRIDLKRLIEAEGRNPSINRMSETLASTDQWTADEKQAVTSIETNGDWTVHHRIDQFEKGKAPSDYRLGVAIVTIGLSGVKKLGDDLSATVEQNLRTEYRRRCVESLRALCILFQRYRPCDA